MRLVKEIIIHCSATREEQQVSVDTIRDWHLAKGWNDIGYHFYIDLDGTINKEFAIVVVLRLMVRHLRIQEHKNRKIVS